MENNRLDWFSVDVILAKKKTPDGFPIRQIARVTSLRRLSEAERVNYLAEYELAFQQYERSST